MTKDYELKPLRQFNHPDLSNFVIHFTGRSGRKNPQLPDEIDAMKSLKRLRSMLTERSIRAFSMFQTPDPVVCFTECTSAGVTSVIKQGRYEPVGIGFSKDTIFEKGGGPAFYVRGDTFEHVEDLPQSIRFLCTRFWPRVERTGRWYTHDNFIDRPSEWLHEREWRVLGRGDPSRFKFLLKEVAFIVVPGRLHETVLKKVFAKHRPDLERFLNQRPFVYIDKKTGEIDDPSQVWVK